MTVGRARPARSGRIRGTGARRYDPAAHTRSGEGYAVRLTPLQSRIWGARHFARDVDEARFRVWIAGRRSGKTTLARIELTEHAIERPNAVAWYVAPTLDMARELMFEPLLETLDPAWISRVNETRMVIRLANGSSIAVKSAERPLRLVGRGVTRVVFDEFAQCDPLAWEKLAPALGDRQGDALFITTPEGIASWAFKFYQRGVARESGMWRAWRTTTAEAGTLTAQDLAALRASMDPRLYAQELEAEFTALLSRIVHEYDDRAWSDGGHVAEFAEDNPDEPLLVGMDFNVHPMTAILGVRAGARLHVFNALQLPTSSTEELARVIRDYAGPDRPVLVVPDASGGNRTTAAAGVTDFTHLEAAGFVVDAPNANPPLRDRFNASNAVFRTADGDRHCAVHPRAEVLRHALLGYRWIENTKTPNDREGWDHAVAAFGYLVHRRFNLLERADFTVGTYR